jgi:hypothetical protein
LCLSHSPQKMNQKPFFILRSSSKWSCLTNRSLHSVRWYLKKNILFGKIGFRRKKQLNPIITKTMEKIGERGRGRLYMTFTPSVFFTYLPFYLSVCLFVNLTTTSAFLPIWHSFYLYVCLSIYTVCLSSYLTIFLPIYLSVCLFVYLTTTSVFLPICHSF